MSQDLRDDFRPTAPLEALRIRARLLAEARKFFCERGHLEVDTPLVSRDRSVDPHIEPFVVREDGRAPPPEELYLQTSAEFAMKRLLASGAGPIYQISHVFRAHERGPRHNPEFTMIEWYAPGTDHFDQMLFTEQLVARLAACAGRRLSQPFDRLEYAGAFQIHAGLDPLSCGTEALRAAARQAAVQPPESLAPDDRDGWLNLLLAEVVEPRLGLERPVFVYHYPASQCALARVRPEPPAVAERFELYMRGVELGNGYHELTDAAELARRVAHESARREARGAAPLPARSRLSLALESGLPACAGVALGFDRLLMVLLERASIDEVLPFAWEQA